MKKLLLLFLLSADYVNGVILTSDRIITWTPGVLGGVPSGITNGPSVTDYGAVGDGTTECSSAITNALAHCPANAAVYFPAGKYLITNAVRLGRTTIYNQGVFRGAGIGTTIILLGMSNSPSGGFYFEGGVGSPGTSNALSSGFTKYSNIVVAASVTGLTNGQFVEIGQTNDPSFGVSMGDLGAQMPFQAQQNQITNISGNTISLLRPLNMTFYSTNFPYIRAWYPLVTNSGIENMTLANVGVVDKNIRMIKCVDCWVKGVECTNYISIGVAIEESFRCEVRECISHHSNVQGSSRYCIDLTGGATDCLIEDNIVGWDSDCIVVQNASTGNVIAYNYVYYDSGSTTLGVGIMCHGGVPSWNLFEGNISCGWVGDDNVHGCNPYNTWVRNWSQAYTTNATSLKTAMHFEDTNYFNNAVGNILCHPHDFNAVGNNPYVWYFLNDPTVISTMVRHGNFEFRTNTLQWDATISDHIIPNSYYLNSKPSWFSNLVWPAMGPDVSVSTNSAITNAVLIPAQARWMGVDYSSLPVTGTKISGNVTISGNTVIK